MNILDFLKKAKRGPAVILPKDIGAIIAHTGVGTGWKVVDAGTGSGFLALFLANIGCKVYTYEKEERFYKISKKNITVGIFFNPEFRDTPAGTYFKVQAALRGLKPAPEKICKNIEIGEMRNERMARL